MNREGRALHDAQRIVAEQTAAAVNRLGRDPKADPIRHHYRRRRGYTSCWLCGRPISHPDHWESTDAAAG